MFACVGVWCVCTYMHERVCVCSVFPRCLPWRQVLVQGGSRRPACWQQLESVSRCELSSVLFGSLAALPLAPNTAVAWPTEQRGMCLCVCMSVLLIFMCAVVHVHVHFKSVRLCRYLDEPVQGSDSCRFVFLLSITSVWCWILSFLLYIASIFRCQLFGGSAS